MKFYALILLGCLSFFKAPAQISEINSAEAAIKVGNANELSRYFTDNIELSFEGQKNSYSRVQAEFVLKDFFTKNTPKPIGFEKYHRGNSGKDLNYAIVRYNANTGSFIVFIKFKQLNGKYWIDSLSLNKE